MTTPEDAARLREIREQSGVVISIGACATAGGIQALKNFADVAEFTNARVLERCDERVTLEEVVRPEDVALHGERPRGLPGVLPERLVPEGVLVRDAPAPAAQLGGVHVERHAPEAGGAHGVTPGHEDSNGYAGLALAVDTY